MCTTTHRTSHPQQGQIPHWFANNCCMSESHPLMCCDSRISARFNKYQSMNKIPILTQNRQSEKKTVLMTIGQYGWCALWCWNNLGTSIPCKIWNQVFVAEHIPHLKTRVLFSVSSRPTGKDVPYQEQLRRNQRKIKCLSRNLTTFKQRTASYGGQVVAGHRKLFLWYSSQVLQHKPCYRDTFFPKL